MDQSNPVISRQTTKTIFFVLGAVFFLALIASLVTTLNKQKSSPDTALPKEPRTQLNLSKQTVVYGTWTKDASLVKAVDLEIGTEYLLAELPPNVKKITVLDNNRILYIGRTDIRDHGENLTVFDINAKLENPTIIASNSLKIDDYVISPNKRYVATWEVEPDPQSGILLGGKSRVYTIDLFNPSKKNLISDEVAAPDSPVHYPRAILDNGKVFMDTFLPNSGAGWAYGMTVSNFEGTQKQDLENVKNGTYATQPDLSPDGKYLVFAGYDGSKGPGDQDVNGFRRALLVPNTIDLLNTDTLERTSLDNLSKQFTYASVKWNNSSQHILFTQIGKNSQNIGVFEYDLIGKSSTKVNLPNSNKTSIISFLDRDTILAGEQNPSKSAVGNLGEEYAQTVTNLSVIDLITQRHTNVSISENLVQYIGLVPSKSFVNFPNITLPSSKSSDQNQQLQLATFVLKPSLAPIREDMQSIPPTPSIDPNQIDPSQYEYKSDPRPRCSDWATRVCNEQGIFQGQAFVDCHAANMNYGNSIQGTGGPCYDSPLYLYGPAGLQVKVTIHTPIFGDIPKYDNGYIVTLEDEGNMLINGRRYSKIAFDYTSALRRLSPLTKGSIVVKEELAQTLRKYAEKLGLNTKETEDLILLGERSIDAPYAFISFFDDTTSKAILPITFDPQPDVYRNIVFYFKNLQSKPNYSVELPTFQKIERKGFTAIEISSLAE